MAMPRHHTFSCGMGGRIPLMLHPHRIQQLSLFEWNLDADYIIMAQNTTLPSWKKRGFSEYVNCRSLEREIDLFAFFELQVIVPLPGEDGNKGDPCIDNHLDDHAVIHDIGNGSRK